MSFLHFTELELTGKSRAFLRMAQSLRDDLGFDFVSIGMTEFAGAPLKWVYSAGATGERHKRIALAPGHGIGGIVLKAGKPMMLLDIDRDLDPREYSSYPIVFAEDLRSFCALPLVKSGIVVGALLCAFRSVRPDAEKAFTHLIDVVRDGMCGLAVVTRDFMTVSDIADLSFDAPVPAPELQRSHITSIIAAQEEERMRISRELHDGVAQELLTVSFLAKRLAHLSQTPEAEAAAFQIDQRIDAIIEELRTMSVTLRPSALDHLGLVAALRSHALMLEKTYGAEIVFDGTMGAQRFDPLYETQVYRIAQEAILNACKYSGVETVYVDIDFDEEAGALSVRVSDQGVGFNAENPEVKGTGCGLPGMRERAKLIGGDLVVRSSSEGTVVLVRVPLRPIGKAV